MNTPPSNPIEADYSAQRLGDQVPGVRASALIPVSQVARIVVRHRLAARGSLAMSLLLTAFVGTAAAQSDVGTTLCGTPIADFINGTAPLVVSLAMLIGTVFAAFMHVRAGLARDAEQARFYLDWRNRAGYTAVTAPLAAFLIQMLIGFTGTGVADCVNVVPFY